LPDEPRSILGQQKSLLLRSCNRLFYLLHEAGVVAVALYQGSPWISAGSALGFIVGEFYLRRVDGAVAELVRQFVPRRSALRYFLSAAWGRFGTSVGSYLARDSVTAPTILVHDTP
jgi:hypothetical protein